jgi:glycosyltransferase involved in cell wall biosynthesis
VVFINRYFHPDHSATSQIASSLAFDLARRGWDVEAVTSRQLYDDPRAALPSSGSGGVRITRVRSTRFGRAGLAGRAIDYASFYLAAFVMLLRRCRPGVVVVAMTDPPLISVIAGLAVALRGGVLVNWLQDLFPEAAEVMGFRLARLTRAARNWSLRRAGTNVAIGELMRARVETIVPREAHSASAAVVIHNWALAEEQPVADLGPAFVAGYSGNLGRAHDVATIAAAIRRMPDVSFTFTGGGARRGEVAALPNVTLRPYEPIESLAQSLASFDVHLVTLIPAAEGLIVPSKFYGIVAVGRPVIFVGARDGEVARLIEESGCGLVVQSGRPDDLVDAVRRLRDDPALGNEMGRRGRELYVKRFRSELAFDQWEQLLERVSA